jgi:hypothetical protein
VKDEEELEEKENMNEIEKFETFNLKEDIEKRTKNLNNNSIEEDNNIATEEENNIVSEEENKKGNIEEIDNATEEENNIETVMDNKIVTVVANKIITEEEINIATEEENKIENVKSSNKTNVKENNKDIYVTDTFAIEINDEKEIFTSPNKKDLEVIHNDFFICNTPKSQMSDKNENKNLTKFFTVESNTLNIEAANPLTNNNVHPNPNKFINATNAAANSSSISKPLQIENLNVIDISNSNPKWDEHLNRDFQGDFTIKESKSIANLKLDKFINTANNSNRTGVTITKIEEVNPLVNSQPVISQVIDKNDQVYKMISNTLNQDNNNQYLNYNHNNHNNSTSSSPSQPPNSNIFKRKVIPNENRKSRAKANENNPEKPTENKVRLDFHNNELLSKDTSTTERNENKVRTIPRTMTSFNSNNNSVNNGRKANRYNNENENEELNRDNSENENEDEMRYDNENLNEDEMRYDNENLNEDENRYNIEKSKEELNRYNNEKDNRYKNKKSNQDDNRYKNEESNQDDNRNENEESIRYNKEKENEVNQDKLTKDLQEDEEMIKLSERNEELKRRLNRLKKNIIKEIDNKKEFVDSNEENNNKQNYIENYKENNKQNYKENSIIFNNENEFSKSYLNFDPNTSRIIFNQPEEKLDEDGFTISPVRMKSNNNKKTQQHANTSNIPYPKDKSFTSTNNKSVIQDKNELENLNVNLSKRNMQNSNKSIRNIEEIDKTKEKLSNVKKMSNKVMNNIIYNYTNLDEEQNQGNNQNSNNLVQEKNLKREREKVNKVSKKVEEKINNKYKRINDEKLKNEKEKELEIFNITRNDVYKSTPTLSPKEASINNKTLTSSAIPKSKHSEKYEKIKEELLKLNSSNLSNATSINNEKNIQSRKRMDPRKEVEELISTNPSNSLPTYSLKNLNSSNSYNPANAKSPFQRTVLGTLTDSLRPNDLPNTNSTNQRTAAGTVTDSLRSNAVPNAKSPFQRSAPGTVTDSLRSNAVPNDPSKPFLNKFINSQPALTNTLRETNKASLTLNNIPNILSTNPSNADPFNMSVSNNSFVPFTTSTYKPLSKSKDKARLFFNLDEVKERLIIDSNLLDNNIQNTSYAYIQHHKKIPLTSMIYPSNEIDYLNARHRRQYYSQLKSLNTNI